MNRAGLAGLLVGLLINLRPAPVDACGIKLTVKTSTPRKAVARSSNPSHLLLIGTPPRRLQRELASKGHKVEVASTAADAKRESYAVVMVVDAKQAADARSSFGDSVVVVRSGDVTADVKSVESRVARTPVRADTSRDVVAARTARTPVAAGPTPRTTRTAITAKAPEPETSQPDPTPTPAVQPVTTAAVTAQPRPVERTAPAPERREQVKAPTVLEEEVYFPTSSSAVRRNPALTRAVRWLNANPDVNVVIEGHADPRGNPDSNLALAQTRAESVRDHLVAAGIAESRLEVISYGDTRLKYAAHDRRNRRVAIEPKN